MFFLSFFKEASIDPTIRQQPKRLLVKKGNLSSFTTSGLLWRGSCNIQIKREKNLVSWVRILPAARPFCFLPISCWVQSQNLFFKLINWIDRLFTNKRSYQCATSMMRHIFRELMQIIHCRYIACLKLIAWWIKPAATNSRDVLDRPVYNKLIQWNLPLADSHRPEKSVRYWEVSAIGKKVIF